MFGNVTALEGLRVTGKYRNRNMQHTCSRHAAWDPHMGGVGGGEGPPKRPITWLIVQDEPASGGISSTIFGVSSVLVLWH